MTTYSSAQRRYLAFCQCYQIPPLPLSEVSVCLFAAFLAHQGLKSQSISTYLSGLRHLQVSSGLQPPDRSEWPRLQYVLKGIARVQPQAVRRRLPITAAIMSQLQVALPQACSSQLEAKLVWAACCMGYFGFMRSGEFTSDRSSEPAMRSSDVAVDSHESPTIVRMKLRKAKTDPFGQGVEIFVSKTGVALCPVSAILNYLAVRPSGEGPLLVHADGSPLTRDQFVKKVKKALRLALVDPDPYSGHSFRIGAASAAAAAGIPAYFIKMLGRWESEAYHLYIKTPRESLAAVSQLIAH